MDYLIIPFFTWFITGITKFIVNCISKRRLAYDLIGYGGMPSNHSAIVSSVTILIALKEGIEHPAFGVSLALSFIVLLDANSLRNKIAAHARYINVINKKLNENHHPLRERLGHSIFEIVAGCLTGSICAYLVYII